MLLAAVKHIIEGIVYKDWRIKVEDDNNYVYLQVCFTMDGNSWRGRKWLLSPHMTRSELVQTAFLAVLAAEEHEVREHFLFHGKPVFNPHIDIYKLMSVCSDLDVRE